MKAALGALAIAAVAACATTHTPSQLVDARVAYTHAERSPGAKLVSADMAEAKYALSAAERSYAEDGATNATKNLAYIAHRKAVTAQARAETARAIDEKRVAIADFEKFRQEQMQAQRAELERAKGAVSLAQQEAESSRQARVAAENKLNQIEGLKSAQTERGLMLTLSGAILFGSGKSELLPAAKKKLGEVAKVLKADQRQILVIGHTDSTGSDDTNQRLSEKRAQSVREYLVAQGLPEDRVRAEGMGEVQPVADNTSPEGRAINRRVEVILEKPKTKTGP
jgi:outer membrane protein OmpA-like peptidoglycan-associated protein